MGETLQIERLSRRFGERLAVDAVSLSVPAGQMLGIIGRSGAGKSTLLRMINRLQPPTSGRIRFGGLEVTGLGGRALRDWRTRCAMIFQQVQPVAPARRADQCADGAAQSPAGAEQPARPVQRR